MRISDEVQGGWSKAVVARHLAEKRGVTTGVHPAGFAAACLSKAGREEGEQLLRAARG